ncbi:hypothetical protein QQF64_012438 [Cirrhinus molitorella]|uniref:Uncharacterized protein n=1 Tax=Cirrhinus molitorella TaxID=172907 RepID=A0ABR3LZL4_9TELE
MVMAAATPAPNLQIILGDSRTDPPHPAQTPMPPPDRAGLNHIGPVNGLAQALACRAKSVVEDGNEDVLGLMSVLSPLYQTQGQIEEEGGGSQIEKGGKKEIPSISPNTRAVDFVNAPTDTSQTSEPKQASVFISAWRHIQQTHTYDIQHCCSPSGTTHHPKTIQPFHND